MKCTGKWCLKDGSSRDASKPLPGNCRSAARQPAGTENEKTGRRQDGMTRGSVPDMAGYQSEDFCKS
ncbi:hypothetical protein NIB75_19655 [Bacteroides uniformis]|nr:hypothetical protein [Bacteroides uniformis]